MDTCAPRVDQVVNVYLVELTLDDGTRALDAWSFQQVCRVMDVGTRALAPCVADITLQGVTLHGCTELGAATRWGREG
jgi:hypothetical protein